MLRMMAAAKAGRERRSTDQSEIAAPTPKNQLGYLLRRWRDTRGRSQLDLSLDAGVSQRHISFIESGRSVPGRGMLLQLATTLQVPLRERNALLLAAGYAPIYPEAAWDAPEMRVITGVLKRMLRQHEPFPALVMDRRWNVLMANEATPRFFGNFADLSKFPQPRNILRMMFDPEALRPYIQNWDVVAAGLLERVRQEAVGRVIDDETTELLASLLAYPNIRDQESAASSPPMPVVPLIFKKDGWILKYFSMVTTVGSPQTIAAQELRVECMFPADEVTETNHAAFLAGNLDEREEQ